MYRLPFLVCRDTGEVQGIKEMEVFSLESNAGVDVHVIQTAKENQQRLTKKWKTEANLAAKEVDGKSTGRGRNRPPAMSSSSYYEEKNYFIKQRPESLTENAKKLSEEEIHLLELDIFKPLDFYELLFNRMKLNDERESRERKIPKYNRTFIIRL